MKLFIVGIEERGWIIEKLKKSSKIWFIRSNPFRCAALIRESDNPFLP